MVKVVNGPGDTKRFNLDDLYRVYEGDDLAAIATSREEACDAQEMLNDLTGKSYHIAPPKALSN